MNEAFIHRPALAREVVELLGPVPPGTVVDATAGGGGHAGLLLAARPDIRLLGIDHQSLAAPEAGEPAVFVVRRIDIDYLKPSRLDEVLEVVTRCAEIGGASLTLDQEVRRGDAVLARAEVVVVLVSPSGKPQRIGSLIRGALERFVNQRA